MNKGIKCMEEDCIKEDKDVNYNHHLRRLEMVSWCPCIVAQARALSRYIPRASGAALCLSRSSTTLV